jgi:hypothetical protein
LNSSRSKPLAWLVAIACLLAPSTLTSAGVPPVQFNRDIRPILADACFKCHGPAQQTSGLRLDQEESATSPAESGVVPIVSGRPDESELVRRVLSTDEAERMPPADSGKELTGEQKDLLRRWVAEGAAFEKHWSFIPPVRPPLPTAGPVQPPSANPIDAFIAERLADEGLSFSPEADRPTLIRRVAFALSGLPPTLAEVDAFLKDRAPGAYERMVDRFLASPRFGEEMARHWLDVARYADTHGLHLDNERQMWAYRDWVVRSFNSNPGFDAFTVSQLAGDLLVSPSRDDLVATGFNRCNVTTSEGGSIDDEWVYRNAVDRAATAAEVWLGLTMGCCQCHDHKFDPLTSKDFYSLYAFFHSADDPPLDGNVLLTAPTIRLELPEHLAARDRLEARIAESRRALDALTSQLTYVDPATLDPFPPVEETDQVWFDDVFPGGGTAHASPGHPTLFVTADQGQVKSGEKALKRSDSGLAQDVYEGKEPLPIPPEAKVFAHVWIDPSDPPKTLMLQYFKGGWLHRAVWGDYDAIQWGAAGTTQRVLIGPLPEAGRWIRLECPAEDIGLSAGDVVTGFAFTQFGGTVYWDRAGVSGCDDPARNPHRSFLAWWSENAGKDVPGLPADLTSVVKAGPQSSSADDVRRRLLDHYLQNVCEDTKASLVPAAARLAEARKEKEALEASIPGTFVFRDMDKPRESFVMLRGQYNKPGERVEPGVPAVLPPLVLEAQSTRATRLDLARWLLSPGHPLTARVTVNRIWQQLFGVGLVKSSFDFGAQGDRPSHPELLDYLAVEFRESGWDVKRLVRLMVTSSVFRQSSRITPELLRRDPENRLFARGPRIRLDAEQIRDNALAAAGLLTGEMGGRGSRPYQPPNIWEPVGFVGSNTASYTQDHGSALYRRSLYVFFKRTAPPPFMANFDSPNREQFCSRRERSNTPLQALQLMNDVQHVEAARGLAQRIITEGGTQPAERIAYGFRLVTARLPDPDEAAVIEELLAAELGRYTGDPEAAKLLVRQGESPPMAGLAEPELAAWTLVANLLFNLDETLTRN